MGLGGRLEVGQVGQWEWEVGGGTPWWTVSTGNPDGTPNGRSRRQEG